jgi:hypothetical protein
METATRASGRLASATVTVLTSSQTATCTLASINWGSLRATGNISGSMETATKAHSGMASSMATASGARNLQVRVSEQTVMKETTTWTRRTAGATLSGRAETATGDDTERTKERASERCDGLTDQFIGAVGRRGCSMELALCCFPTARGRQGSSTKMNTSSL